MQQADTTARGRRDESARAGAIRPPADTSGTLASCSRGLHPQANGRNGAPGRAEPSEQKPRALS